MQLQKSKWEYQIFTTQARTVEGLKYFLNELGKDGWEVYRSNEKVVYNASDGYGVVCEYQCKRPLQDMETKELPERASIQSIVSKRII